MRQKDFPHRGRIREVRLGNNVTSIGDGVFFFCSGLSSAAIGNSVTSIGYEAFYGCTSLASVTLGNSVTNIGEEAFVACMSLSNFTMPNSVTGVGIKAISDCTSLTNVTIGTNVTSIGDWAFVSCHSLTSVTIPNSVTDIGSGVFESCTSLSAITVDMLNPVYSSVAGVLFNKSQTTLNEYPAGRAGTSYTIPNSVTNIGEYAFASCTRLTSVTIPNSVTSIGGEAFADCYGLTSMTIPDSVTNIGYGAFELCEHLTSVTIPSSVTGIGGEAFADCYGLTNVTIGTNVTSIGNGAFGECYGLTGVYFEGDAPSLGSSSVFENDSKVIVYYLPGTTGWGTTFGGRPTALWVQEPSIETPPQTQTAEAGSAVGLWVDGSSPLPLLYLWRLEDTNIMGWSTNWDLELTNAQFSQSGAYTVVVSNVLGAATSGPAMLNVIAAVERRPVPGVKVTGEAGSLLNVDYAGSLSPAPHWTTLGSVSLTSTSQYYFDLTFPLPPQRYYQAWQTGAPGLLPSLDLHLVAAITLTGSLGASLRLDYINQFGPTDAWVTLGTVTLTNTSQLYFDVSAPGQPQRLYRLVPLP